MGSPIRRNQTQIFIKTGSIFVFQNYRQSLLETLGEQPAMPPRTPSHHGHRGWVSPQDLQQDHLS
jgi:hypothetical protein